MVPLVKPTPTQRLLTLHLGRDVRDVIADLVGDDRGPAYIARHLTDATDGAVPVTRQQVHQWCLREGWSEAQDATA